MCNDHNHHNSFVKGAFLGALIGTVLGILYAPLPGEKSRKKLKEVSEDLAERGQERFGELVGRVEDARTRVEPIVEKAKETIETLEKRVGKSRKK